MIKLLGDLNAEFQGRLLHDEDIYCGHHEPCDGALQVSAAYDAIDGVMA